MYDITTQRPKGNCRKSYRITIYWRRVCTLHGLGGDPRRYRVKEFWPGDRRPECHSAVLATVARAFGAIRSGAQAQVESEEAVVPLAGMTSPTLPRPDITIANAEACKEEPR
jgi:hypothetical protein